MAELVEPVWAAAWADFASVRRTIEWVSTSLLEKSMFTGATVGRLLRRIGERHAPEGAVLAQLEAMTSLWMSLMVLMFRVVRRSCKRCEPYSMDSYPLESWEPGATISSQRRSSPSLLGGTDEDERGRMLRNRWLLRLRPLKKALTQR